MTALFAVPVPATPAAGKAAARSRRYSRSHYRGGVPTFADSSSADNSTYDDPVVHEAAVEALGRFNGSVVAVDPNTGRILTMVNQKLALSSGFQPCSTIKVSVALAALSENAVNPASIIKIHREKVDMTYALAHSVNEYFAGLGQKLG